MTAANACPLCEQEGGEVLWRNTELRVVHTDEETLYPGLCRVIWNAHVAEFSDLTATQRHMLMDVVTCVEHVMRTMLAPTKMNLASLGNQVPHLHWHLIPRYSDDAHFPQPIWSPALRPVAPALLEARQAQAQKLRTGIMQALASLAI